VSTWRPDRDRPHWFPSIIALSDTREKCPAGCPVSRWRVDSQSPSTVRVAMASASEFTVP
jgi:hypothetical protein